MIQSMEAMVHSLHGERHDSKRRQPGPLGSTVVGHRLVAVVQDAGMLKSFAAQQQKVFRREEDDIRSRVIITKQRPNQLLVGLPSGSARAGGKRPGKLMAATSIASVEAKIDPAPKLSVIVPAYNSGYQLRECLKALKDSRYENFEVIVVDDCSTDDLSSIAYSSGVRYLRTPSNIGPGAARNLAARQAEGEILVFVDSDVVVDPDVLPRMAENFVQDPELAGVFGSYDEDPGCSDFLSQHKNMMHHYIHQVSKEQAVSFWAGCGALRKSVFLKFGGFNALMFPKPSIEDIELGYRLTQAGQKIKLDKRLQGKHLKRWTLYGLLHADIFCRAVPWAKLIVETRHLPRDLNLTYSARLSALFVGFLLATFGLLPFSLAHLRWFPQPLHLGLAMVLIGMGLLVLNRRMYRWFARRKGYWFTVRVILLHWLYYFYGGVSFVFCMLIYRPVRTILPKNEIAMPSMESKD